MEHHIKAFFIFWSHENITDKTSYRLDVKLKPVHHERCAKICGKYEIIPLRLTQ